MLVPAIFAAAVSFVEIDPGHFHAALVLNRAYPGVEREVRVFAPKGPELDAHLALVRDFNGREKDPTDWNETVYTGGDYLARAVAAHRDGAVAILAGRNDLKPDYLLAAAKAGYHILADKPMAVTPEGFAKLEEAVRECERRGTLVDDVMTERHEITTILQRELSRDRAVYGEQEAGTPDAPAVTKESVHHFCKLVNGKPLTRPGWFYDVTKEGEGITDVTTHLVDLIQWETFPEVPLTRGDVEMLSARGWATPLTAADYRLSTGLDEWPAYLRGAVDGDNVLQCRANGEFTYRLKGVCAKVSVRWDFMPPQGGGDTHYSLMRGTKAELVIRQGKEQGFRPALYVRPRGAKEAVGAALQAAVARLAERYPGIAVGAFADGAWRIEIPKRYDIGHEAHFSQEVEEFLGWLRAGNRPNWELPNMMVKYWTIQRALEMSRAKPEETAECPVFDAVRGHENVEWSVAYAFNLTDGRKDLPRAMLIGDSICNAYKDGVRRLLDGRMTMACWASSYCVTSPEYLRLLSFYLDEVKYDVIHFNNGLHSLGTAEDDYGKGIRAALSLIRRKQPSAKIVWATSTPLTDGRKTEKVKRLNAVAAKVVSEFGDIGTDDLFSAMDPLDRKKNWVDPYHFTKEVQARQAKIVADSVLSEGVK